MRGRNPIKMPESTVKNALRRIYLALWAFFPFREAVVFLSAQLEAGLAAFVYSFCLRKELRSTNQDLLTLEGLGHPREVFGEQDGDICCEQRPYPIHLLDNAFLQTRCMGG